MIKYMIILFCTSLIIEVHAQKYNFTKLSYNQFKEDLTVLTTKLTSVHPVFVDTVILKNWSTFKDSITSMKADSITLNLAFLKMATLLSVLEDGHSGFNFPFEERLKYMQNGGTTMPFSVRIEGENIFIEQFYGTDRSDSFEGSLIISINSISSKEMLQKMRSLHGEKKLSLANSTIAKYFAPYYWMIYGEHKGSYELKIVDSKGKGRNVLFASVDMKQYFESKSKYYPQQPDKLLDFKFLDHNKYAWMKINLFRLDTVYTTFLKNSFDTINKIKCTNLIIDIRDNPGGNSNAGDLLLDYLTDTSYSQFASVKLRVSEDVKNRYKKNEPKLYEHIKSFPNNTLFPFPNEMLFVRERKNAIRFKGNLIVVVSDKTFSSAASFTGVVKKYKLGKIIGEVTGGRIHCYGDFLMFKLPNSGFEFFVSTKEHILQGGNIEDEGVIPDIKMKTNNLQVLDIINASKK
jgi:hypothetical protein